jgi:hypothetical protein
LGRPKRSRNEAVEPYEEEEEEDITSEVIAICVLSFLYRTSSPSLLFPLCLVVQLNLSQNNLNFSLNENKSS